MREMIPDRPTLIGDGIENPWNALTMIHGAEMLGSPCLFRDGKGLSHAWHDTIPTDSHLQFLSVEQMVMDYSSIVAFDNLEHAVDLYSFRPAKDRRVALVVGNERLGVSKDICSIAQHAVQIPMISKTINCLNVAAASAVGLYYLSRGKGQKLQVRSNPESKRPDLLMMGVADHIELGSSIRSACAFGWGRTLVDDRFGTWFGCDRVTRSEGRGAARRGRNPIRLIPIAPSTRYTFSEVCVITSRPIGTPIHQANLARGPQQLIVIPDESRLRIEDEPWDRFGRAVNFIHLDLPTSNFTYHYRLLATIVLAEVARQVGQRARPVMRYPKRPKPFYDQSLRVAMAERGELLFLEDLVSY